MSNNGKKRSVTVSTEPNRVRASAPILLLAVLFVIAAFLSWYLTWFGRGLSDSEISQYLDDVKHPRKVQHALLQIQERIERGDANARQWYPSIILLAGNPETEFRLTVAWVMGFDNRSEPFHQSLLKLIQDPEPIVRRNAALALVRFNDASGRRELTAILEPYEVQAPSEGKVASTLHEGSPISRGTLLARIGKVDGAVAEIRAPLPGHIGRVVIENDAFVSAGQTMLTITSDEESLWETLRGLALVGRREDLPEIEYYSKAQNGVSERVKQQAALTAKSIREGTNQQK